MNERFPHTNTIEQLDSALDKLKTIRTSTTAEIRSLSKHVLTISDPANSRIMVSASQCVVDYERASESLSKFIKRIKKERRNLLRSVTLSSPTLTA